MRAHVCTSIAALHDGHKCHSPSTPPDTANQSPSCKAPVLLGRRACLGAAALSIYLSTQQSKSIAADRDPPVLIDALPEQDIRGLTSLQADMVTRGIPQNPGPSFAVTKKQKQLFYPPWLQVCGDEVVVTIAPPTTVPPQGTWQAEGRLVGIAFPQGGQMLSPSVPGFTKGSLIAAIADVGVGQDAPIAMRMRWVDSPQEGGVVADRYVILLMHEHSLYMCTCVNVYVCVHRLPSVATTTTSTLCTPVCMVPGSTTSRSKWTPFSASPACAACATPRSMTLHGSQWSMPRGARTPPPPAPLPPQRL